MASLIRYPRSRYWVAAFRDASGRQHRRTTREVDKKRAQAVADQFERVAKRKGDPQRVRAVFADFYREHYGSDLPQASVADYAKRWLKARRSEVEPTTFKRYEKTCAKFLAFLGTDAGRDLTEITKGRIAEFRDAQAASGLAGATANKELKIIKMLFRAARIDGLLWQDPTEGVKPVKDANERADRRAFTLSEVSSILAIADPEWQALIKTGLYTGQRLGDLARLCWNQIDFERDEIRLVARKTGKRVNPPIAPALREVLLALAGDDPDAPLFPRAYKALTAARGLVNTLSKQFVALLKAAGLRAQGETQERKGFDLSFHSLRYTSVTLLKEAGVPDAVVMALVGHEAVRQSDHYTRIGKEALAKAAAALPEL